MYLFKRSTIKFQIYVNIELRRKCCTFTFYVACEIKNQRYRRTELKMLFEADSIRFIHKYTQTKFCLFILPPTCGMVFVE